MNKTVERVKTVMTRHGWNQGQMADYLGVPRGTLGNWLQGTREPATVVTRLLDVLETIAWAAPAVHDKFKPKDGK